MIAGTEMGTCAFLELESGEKEKWRGEMYFTGQDCRLVYFCGGFFAFCFLYNNTDRRCALSFPFSFFKEKNKAGPP